MKQKQGEIEVQGKDNKKRIREKKDSKILGQERQKRFRERTRVVTNPMKIKVTIEDVWRLYPTSHFSTKNDRTTSDDDYGMHGKLHNFTNYINSDQWDYKFGSLSIGLTYDKKHSAKGGRDKPKVSEGFVPFLLTVKKYLLQKYKSDEHIINSPMRVACINGAKTKGHTDCDKGNGPTFVLLEKDDGFVLSVRLFPTFHCSVVQFKNKLYIPHRYSDNEGFIMIQYYKGRLTFHIFPCHVVEEVEPYGDIVGYNIIGIKQNKLQVVNNEYKIYEKSKDLPMITFEEAIEIASKNRKYPKDYKRKHKYIQYKKGKKDEKNKAVHRLYLWKHIHRWLPGTNHLSKRIYVYFRPIREETPGQRLRHTDKYQNWIVLDEDANVLDYHSLRIACGDATEASIVRTKFSKYMPVSYHTLTPYKVPEYVWVCKSKWDDKRCIDYI